MGRTSVNEREEVKGNRQRGGGGGDRKGEGEDVMVGSSDRWLRKRREMGWGMGEAMEGEVEEGV